MGRLMSISRNKGIRSVAALIACGALLIALPAADSSGSPTAASAAKNCIKAKSKTAKRKRSARKSRIRCSGGRGSGPGTTTTTPTTTTTTPTTTTTTPPPPPPPPIDPAPNPDCPLAQPNSTVGMTVPSSCTVVASDTASNPDPISFWGKIDCEASSREQQQTAGGDSHLTATGTSQGNSAFRRATVIDGDDVWGERCELGNNWSQPTGATPAGPGPTMFYQDGERRLTYASLRLPSSTPMGSDWRTVLQMKQMQPYNNPTPGPIIELQLRGNQWMLVNSWQGIWTAPAQQNTWTRFAFDVTYSPNPSIGSIKVYADLNGDGDFGDANEQSSVIHTATLETETVTSSYSPYGVGQSIPDHLRTGIYQDPNYSCPTGCSMDVDNVQVIRP
jgi:polysaccharide lyase-like protein